MAIKKSEIYSELWKSCDKLRGGMDASQYKDYILAILFVKYLSDKYSGKKDSPITIPKGGSFADMVALKGKPKIGTGINDILKKLSSEIGLGGTFNKADFDDPEKLGSGKAKVDRLSDIITIFQSESLDFSKNRADGDDILGDAFEYLMKKFATQSGKAKGQFYTPSEVSQIIAKVVGAKNAKRKDWTAYDPTAGSGSLLLKVEHETPHGITTYGQENDVATTAMARMNMWIHKNEDAEIVQGNTISQPFFKNKDGTLKEFDFVVSNPPFSDKAWSTGIEENNDEYKRFDGYGIPPKKNGDYAFLLHVIKSINNTGKGAIILPHGVLFRGNVEAEIRKNIIKRGYIKGIIGLPPNLFYGTSISASIIIFDKENAKSRKGIFIIDASKGFVKDGNKNRLQAKDIHRIVDSFEKQLEIPKFSRMIPLSEISNEKNEYTLNITRYIDNQEEEDIQDIEAHLEGGIPSKDIDDLEKYWKVYPSIRKILFSPNKRVGYENLNLEKSKISSTIFDHSEFQTYSNKFSEIFNQWKTDNISLLDNIKTGTNPKKLIIQISEDILNKFSKISLIDNYDVYQYLMGFWDETMQDDCYLISQNGWNVSLFHPKTKNGNEKGWDSELIPKNIVISKYFKEDQNFLENFQNNLEKIEQQKETLEEENSVGDEDIFSEARSNAGKITKGEITKRLKIIKNVSEFSDEFNILTQYLKLIEKQGKLKIEIKIIEKDLDKNLIIKYNSLKELEIKEIVIQDKWLESINNLVNEEMENISHKLGNRINELVKRYEKTLSELTDENQLFTNKVGEHLRKMGFKP
jgi:type I restriction enzyme M protein